MNTLFFVGIDVASESHTAAIYHQGQPFGSPLTFASSDEGFEKFRQWLNAFGITPQNSVICLEATGVYSESITYHLAAHHWRIAVEAPQHVKRGMGKPQKNDSVDAEQIAEYACRYHDKLHFWQAPSETLERISTLLSTRSHCSTQAVAVQNMLSSLTKKVVRTASAEAVLHEQYDALKKQIKRLDACIKEEIDSDDHFRTMMTIAQSVPGVGPMLATQLLVFTQGFTKTMYHKQLASYLGICPHEHQSGTSVYRNPRSRRSGPGDMRRLLFLSAMSVKRCTKRFGDYYQQKKAVHKNGHLILNNIANKLLKILCAVINSRTEFSANHVSKRTKAQKKLEPLAKINLAMS